MNDSNQSSGSPHPISRREFLRRSAVAATVPSLVSGTAVSSPSSGKHPNILWICTDQQRFDTIQALGNQHIHTPNLDRLAASGVAFANAYCQAPICTPSRASFLTGLYPETEHVLRNGNAWFPERFVKRLIVRILADAGYDCGLVGKLHLSSCAHQREPHLKDYGYRLIQWSHTPIPSPGVPLESEDYQRWLHEHGVEWRSAFGARKLPGWPALYNAGISAKYAHSTWCADEAIAFLSEKLVSPWLMSVNMFSPHPLLPWTPKFYASPEYLERMNPKEMPLPAFRPSDLVTFRALRGVDHQTTTPQNPADYPSRYMVAAYYACVEQVDAQVGRILDALESKGQRDNTIVLFTSDHGEMLGDHGLVFKGCRFYEGAVHVPLIISWPGHFRSGVFSKALVQLTDIVPTLLDAIGTGQPHDLYSHVSHGQSLFPILTGSGDLNTHRPFVRSSYHNALHLNNEHGTHGNMIFDGRWKLSVYQPGWEIVNGIREAASPTSKEGELYDLTEDPHEFLNRWDDPAARRMKNDLIHQLFNALELATDPGQPRISGF
jgi:arylsulfatase